MALCVLLDVFQREGNVRYLVVAHSGACVGSGLVARNKIRVDVHTIGGFALDDEPAFIECRANTAVIHYLFNHAAFYLTVVPYCFSEACTAVAGKAVSMVARARKPVHNCLIIPFIFHVLLSWI